MKYWAFLSYSHTDKKWGDWIHKTLETYRLPRRLIGKNRAMGKCRTAFTQFFAIEMNFRFQPISGRT